jgi:murein L,D-transpeptidase YcbB/YkuD
MHYTLRDLFCSPWWIGVIFAAISYNTVAQQSAPLVAGQTAAAGSASGGGTLLVPQTASQVGVATVESANPPNGRIAKDLQQRLQTGPGEKLYVYEAALHSPQLVQRFYSQRAYRPAWIGTDDKPRMLAEDLLVAVLNANRDGLRMQYYHGEEIKTQLRSLRIAFAPTVRQLADFDLLLTDTFLTFGSDLLRGRIDPKALDKDWVLSPRSRDMSAVLEQALAQNNIHRTLADLSPTYAGYTRTRAALAHYRSLHAGGGWPVIGGGRKLEPGMHSPRVQELRTRLQISGDLADTLPTADQYLFDDNLVEALRRFQERHGLRPDGVLGPRTLAALNVPVSERIRQLEFNLERWRWLPEDLGQRHVLVNIPNFRMSVIENGREIIGSKVVVGMAKRPTPILTADMQYLVFSPYWHVPRTIAVEDKLPMLRKNPYSLRKQGIRVFSGGREIDPGGIDWNSISKNSFPYSLRQDPGPANALGGIKFMFPNRHSVYLHDTSAPHLFNRVQRTYSSGCVRVETPYELAEYLLRDHSDWTVENIKKASKTGRERRVDLTGSIPVHMLYWTAWSGEDGAVNFRNDIYERDIALSEALLTI